MGLRKFMDQAKAQVEDATSGRKQKLDEAREKLQEKLHSRVDEAKVQAAEMTVSGKQKLGETRERLQVAMDEAQQKAEEVLRRAEALLPQVMELEPILKDLGFAVCEVEVTLSVAPGLAVIIEQQVADVKGVLESALEKREPPLTDFQRRTIGLLAKATDFAAKMTGKYGYRAQQYELTLLPPAVIVHFGPHGSPALPLAGELAQQTEPSQSTAPCAAEGGSDLPDEQPGTANEEIADEALDLWTEG